MQHSSYFCHNQAWNSLMLSTLCRDDEDWDASPGPQIVSPAGQRHSGSFAGNPHLMLSARGNSLDLRPATASGVITSEHSSASSRHDAHATRETDLGSLSAQLFAPRPQVGSAMLPFLCSMSCWLQLAVHHVMRCVLTRCGVGPATRGVESNHGFTAFVHA